MRVLLFSRYDRLGASSRLRSYQYIPYLKNHNIKVTVAPLFGDEYIRALYNGKVSLFSVIKSYSKRIFHILKVHQYDVVWVEKEMLPWFPSWFELGLFPKSVRLVLDYDDARFHMYDNNKKSIIRYILGRKIDALMKQADLVMVGNEYLEDRAKKAGATFIERVPTVVDLTKYTTVMSAHSNPITIGWIGTPNTERYLFPFINVFKELIRTQNVRFVFVGANQERFSNLPFEIHKWSENTEVEEIQQFDIGIMPLPDEPFERGKCGYKLIQYMACGKPVVASPIGVNQQLVEIGVNGFLAETGKEWFNFLTQLCNNTALRIKMGQAGRDCVENKYSLQVIAPKLGSLIKSLADNNFKKENV